MDKVQVVILSNTKKQTFCLLLQTNEKRGSFWQNVTGSVEPSDTNTQDAALREVLEETGLSNDLGEIYPLNYSFHYEDKNSAILTEDCFLFITNNCPQVTISALEHSNYKWVALDELGPKAYGHESNYDVFKRSLLKLGELK